MTTWLVTGATGFLGRHVMTQIMRTTGSSRSEIHSIARRPRSLIVGGSGVIWHTADLTDHDRLCDLVAEIRPDRVVHLAGITSTGRSEELYRQNTLATILLCDALKRIGTPCRMVLAGSAAELGPVPSRLLPVSEEYPARPTTAYGISKHLASTAALIAGSPLEVLVARIFNPIGPGMPERLALGRFASRLAEPGTEPIRLVVGNINARRDFVDVRDVADALVGLATDAPAGRIYHVGTGRSRRIGEALDYLIAQSRRPVEVVQDPAKLDRGGPLDSCGDPSRIREAIDWAPQFSWTQSLDDLWHERLGRAHRPQHAA